MGNIFSKCLKFFLFLSATVLLLYFAFRGLDMNAMLIQIGNADYRWVAASSFFCIIALVFRTLRWHLLIEPLGDDSKKINIFHAINIGYLANFFFPRIGEITRCAALAKTDRISVDKLFGTVVVERIFDLLMTIFLLCLMLILRFHAVSSFIEEYVILIVIEKIKSLEKVFFIAVVLILLLIFVIYKLFLKKMMKTKAEKIFVGFVEGVKTITQLRKVTLFIALNFLIFGAYLMQTYIMFFALDSSSSLELVDALFVLVLSALAIIIPVQGGIGAYHWIISIGLTVFGLTREEGMAYATLSHTATSVLFIILGIISAICILCIQKTKQTKTKPQEKI